MSEIAAGDTQWVRIAALSNLDPEFPILVKIGEAELAVGTDEAGNAFAVANICSHAFARLSDGFVQGEEIFCPLHQGSFNVHSGAAVASPCFEPIRSYQVKVQGDDLYVDVGSAAASAQG